MKGTNLAFSPPSCCIKASIIGDYSLAINKVDLSFESHRPGLGKGGISGGVLAQPRSSPPNFSASLTKIAAMEDNGFSRVANRLVDTITDR